MYKSSQPLFDRISENIFVDVYIEKDHKQSIFQNRYIYSIIKN